MSNVADDGVVLHLFHVTDDVDKGNDICEAGNDETLHARLQRADWVALGDIHYCALSLKGHSTAFLPAIITSVARMMPSGSECLQPYKLSNLDLVTLSFTPC